MFVWIANFIFLCTKLLLSIESKGNLLVLYIECTIIQTSFTMFFLRTVKKQKQKWFFLQEYKLTWFFFYIYICTKIIEFWFTFLKMCFLVLYELTIICTLWCGFSLLGSINLYLYIRHNIYCRLYIYHFLRFLKYKEHKVIKLHQKCIIFLSLLG